MCYKKKKTLKVFLKKKKKILKETSGLLEFPLLRELYIPIAFVINKHKKTKLFLYLIYTCLDM